PPPSAPGPLPGAPQPAPAPAPPSPAAPASPSPAAPASPAAPGPASAAPASAAPANTPAPAAAASQVDLDHLRRAWPSVLALVKRKKITAEAMLHEALPSDYAEGELVLEFKRSQGFHREQVSDPRKGYLNPLVEALSETFGIRPTIRCVLGENGKGSGGDSDPSGGYPSGFASGHYDDDGPGNGPEPSPPMDPIDLIRKGFAAEIVEET
ncbi:MAG: hypothetical protein ACRDJU_15385, partial [Actinomycetota bacterium]